MESVSGFRLSQEDAAVPALAAPAAPAARSVVRPTATAAGARAVKTRKTARAAGTALVAAATAAPVMAEVGDDDADSDGQYKGPALAASSASHGASDNGDWSAF
jgi:methyl-accepting chemotaxis protein